MNLFTLLYLIYLTGNILYAGGIYYDLVQESSISGGNLYGFLLPLLSIVVLTILLFVSWDRFVYRQTIAVRAINLFVISFVIVHFQYYMEYVWGGVDFSWRLDEHPIILKESCLLSFLGLHSCLLGYVLYAIKDRTKRFVHANSKKKPILDKSKHAQTVLGISRYLGVLFLGLFLYEGKGYLFAMQYGQQDVTGTLFGYIQLILQIIILCVLLIQLLICQQESRRISWVGFVRDVGWFNAVIIVYCLAIFMSGDRGPVINTLLAYLVVGQMATRKYLNYLTLIGLIVVSALLLTIWGDVRRNTRVDNITEQISSSYSELSNSEETIVVTAELAGSVRTLHCAVENVPSRFDHTNGVFQMVYLLQAIPFVGTYMIDLLFGDLPFVQSTTMLTWIIQGDLDSSGVGTSCIADVYIEFGVIGVIIMMFLLGVLFQKSDILYTRLIAENSIFSLCLYFMVLIQSYYIPRSAILFMAKDVCWMWFVLYILLAFVKNKKYII